MLKDSWNTLVIFGNSLSTSYQLRDQSIVVTGSYARLFLDYMHRTNHIKYFQSKEEANDYNVVISGGNFVIWSLKN